jgi:hypothetical protein
MLVVCLGHHTSKNPIVVIFKVNVPYDFSKLISLSPGHCCFQNVTTFTYHEKNAASNVACKKNVDHGVFCCDDWMAQISTLRIFGDFF